MKVIFEFGDDDQDAAQIALKASSLLACLQEFDRELRQKIKHADEQTMNVESVRQMLRDAIEDHDLGEFF